MQNKKIIAFLFIFLFTLSITGFSLAQEIIENPTETETFQKAQEAKDRLDEFKAEDAKSEYLQKEWTEVLKNSQTFGWLYKSSPVLKFIFDQEFSLSWSFVTAIILWIGFLTMYYHSVKFLSNDSLTCLAVSILITIITSHLLTEKIIEFYSNIIKTFWQNAFLILGIIVIFVIANQILIKLSKSIKKKNQEKRIENLENEVKETYEDIVKGTSEMKKGSEKRYF
jgi:L-lactate permease